MKDIHVFTETCLHAMIFIIVKGSMKNSPKVLLTPQIKQSAPLYYVNFQKNIQTEHIIVHSRSVSDSVHIISLMYLPSSQVPNKTKQNKENNW